MRITFSFSYDMHGYTYRFKFSNEIMSDKERNKGKQRLRYILEKWKKIRSFDIINNISEHVTLLNLI